MKSAAQSSWGGPRIGAGRKPRLQYEAREAFNQAVDGEWGTILTHLSKWIQEGDKQTIRFILEQRFGKAPQTVGVNQITSTELVSSTNHTHLEKMARRLGEQILEEQKTLA